MVLCACKPLVWPDAIRPPLTTTTKGRRRVDDHLETQIATHQWQHHVSTPQSSLAAGFPGRGSARCDGHGAVQPPGACLRSIPNGFEIRAADDSEECRHSFHALVAEGLERALNEHYEMKPHRSAIDPKRRYDCCDYVS